jgi:hypothetical protein
MRTTAAVAVLACLALASCVESDLPNPRGPIPADWVAEAWFSTQAYVQREMFPCHICYGFHGTPSEHGGSPSYLIADERTTVTCPDCAGVGFRRCAACTGRTGGVCKVCEGFGVLRCPDPNCALVRIVDIEVSRPSGAMKETAVGCPACDWKGGDCTECRVLRPDLEALKTPDRGEIRWTSRDACETCRSRGVVDCPFCEGGFGNCPSCRGSGFERGRCPACGGEGRIWPKKFEFERRRVRERSAIQR